jgi:hypothetical protein
MRSLIEEREKLRPEKGAFIPAPNAHLVGQERGGPCRLMKDDLAGGRLPSWDFGANAAGRVVRSGRRIIVKLSDAPKRMALLLEAWWIVGRAGIWTVVQKCDNIY